MPTTDDATALPDDRSSSAAPAADDAAVAVTGGVPPERRRRLVRGLFALTTVVLVVDQLTKVWAVAALEPRERTPLLGDLLGLQLVRNPGAALSIATGMTWVLTVVAVAVVVVIVRTARRIGSPGWALALGLLLGGALGNLVDRMLREPGPFRGHVIDFLAYGRLFVGNVADIAIVVAAVLVVWLTARGVHVDGTRDARTGGDEPAPASQASAADDGGAA
ncbi:lipoprotein signal peptidase [Cellulomonas flavigena DSM 20109]|uniref:Lipoprotein signal peptidase n=1 Tax=Cellulomonas flavigena (strain ATCC 482 / DSM 20109 / BCRC 11376 / JCM 18109 / NBRC 3775 / NCIMB 8073 / NRS 134) TaxID=446466 RepID=D5UDU4_CELFN|nr:signal peptidase II [Cellulomonas flavigena]ADG74502.1 lipoprotein signal peptidase [Cellulomonas flavigena DSM 20109]